jgi:hypothetical protein
MDFRNQNLDEGPVLIAQQQFGNDAGDWIGNLGFRENGEKPKPILQALKEVLDKHEADWLGQRPVGSKSELNLKQAETLESVASTRKLYGEQLSRSEDFEQAKQELNQARYEYKLAFPALRKYAEIRGKDDPVITLNWMRFNAGTRANLLGELANVEIALRDTKSASIHQEMSWALKRPIGFEIVPVSIQEEAEKLKRHAAFSRIFKDESSARDNEKQAEKLIDKAKLNSYVSDFW